MTATSTTDKALKDFYIVFTKGENNGWYVNIKCHNCHQAVDIAMRTYDATNYWSHILTTKPEGYLLLETIYWTPGQSIAEIFAEIGIDITKTKNNKYQLRY